MTRNITYLHTWLREIVTQLLAADVLLEGLKGYSDILF